MPQPAGDTACGAESGAERRQRHRWAHQWASELPPQPEEKEAHRRVLWLAEDHCVVAQSAASRNVKGRLDLHVRLCGLQPGAHAKSHGQHSSGAVSRGRSVCEWRRDDHSGASVGEKRSRKTTQKLKNDHTRTEIRRSTQNFSSLLVTWTIKL